MNRLKANIFLFFLSVSFCTIAQQFKDINTLQSIPVYITGVNKDFLSLNISGFTTKKTSDSVQINAFGYQSIKTTLSDSVIFLSPTLIGNTNYSHPQAIEIIKKIHHNKKTNDPERSTGFEYFSYNKFYISSEKIKLKSKPVANFLRKYFSLNLNIPTVDDKHFILIESESKRNYKSPINDEETIIKSKITGINKPNFITINSQVNSLSLYKNFLDIAAKSYTNPIPPTARKRYVFQLIDTINTNTNQYYIIKFNPKKGAKFESLSGIIIVSKKDWGIKYFSARPSIKRGKTTISYHQSNNYHKNYWFPNTILTSITPQNLGSKKSSFTATSLSIIFNHSRECSKKKFTDIALKFTPKIDSNINRKVPLSKKDQNTYTFYKGLGQIHNFDKVIKIGEHLYNKEVYLKYYTMFFDQVVRYNKYEKLRLGLGMKTNDKISKKINVGGFIAYGFGDDRAKYGANVKFKIIKEEVLTLNIETQTNDIESGANSFINSPAQYSSEWLRKLKVARMDRIITHKIELSSHPIRFLTTQVYFQHINYKPNYDYEFNGLTRFKYNITGLNLRYSFGELFLKIEEEKVALKNNFPIFFLHFNHGKALQSSIDDFFKVESKIEYSLQFPTFGTSLFQLHAGKNYNQTPYVLNFNGKGSREIATVAHNSFETMKYNEFTNDQFLTLYSTHNFGYLNFLRWKNFRPKAHIAFNMGYGKLKNSFSHQKINVQDFSKGYYEVGFLIKELVQIKAAVLKINFGIGIYQRIGNYAYAKTIDNTVLKIALGFKL